MTFVGLQDGRHENVEEPAVGGSFFEGYQQAASDTFHSGFYLVRYDHCCRICIPDNSGRIWLGEVGVRHHMDAFPGLYGGLPLFFWWLLPCEGAVQTFDPGKWGTLASQDSHRLALGYEHQR